MVGDQSDILLRLKRALPLRWFPANTPVLDTLLGGICWSWSWIYNLIQYVRLQTRIKTARSGWLDLIAWDYFGTSVQRRIGESDERFRSRIQAELIRERGTRRAVASSVRDLTGFSPAIFEPANPHDTGGYGGQTVRISSLGYNVAGGWGSCNLPFQFFVTARRPAGSGIATVSGWARGGGGYRVGAIEYASLDAVESRVTDSDIYQAITAVLPTGVTAWTRIID